MFTPEEAAALDQIYFNSNDRSCLALCKKVQVIRELFLIFSGPMFLSRPWIRASDNSSELNSSPNRVMESIEQTFDEMEWIKERVTDRLDALGFLYPERFDWLDRDFVSDLKDDELTPMYLEKLGEAYRERAMIWLNHLEDTLIWFALQNELPSGWKGRGDGKSLPCLPIRTSEDLLNYLRGILRDLSTSDPCDYSTLEIDKEFRNARVALRELFEDPSVRPQFNDCPKDFYEAERELERLIDLLTSVQPPAGSTEPKQTALPLSEHARENTQELIQSDVPNDLLPSDIARCHKLAFQQYQRAEATLGAEVEDDKAHLWCVDNREEGDRVVSLNTWKRYLREVRKCLDQQKSKPRHGRTGKSVAKREEL